MAKYRPRHDTQYEPRTIASPYDCNMAASADAARFWSLGLIDRNHDQMRHLSGTYGEVTDSDPTNNGTDIADAAHALQALGIPSTVYDRTDGKGFADVKAALARGEVVIAHGDYGSVPRALRGPIDRAFTGWHSVLYHSFSPSAMSVGDGLADPWLVWPLDVADAYMRDFPGGGYTFLTVAPRKLKAKVARAHVRSAPRRANNVIGHITPRSRIHYGGTVLGERIGGNATWYKVWYAGKIGYVHSSVAQPA